jgi:hypothetical protein
MEIILLNELKWDILNVTPVEYLDYLFNMLKIKLEDQLININIRKLAEDSNKLIILCLTGT